MAEIFSIHVGDQSYEVMTAPVVNDTRSFAIQSIPLRCTVQRQSRNDSPELRYIVDASVRVSVPRQELYTSSEYDEALDDSQMLSHAGFVIGLWAKEQIVAES